MATVINVSDEILKTLNPKVCTLVDRSSDNSDFIYVPSIKLYVARQRTHLGKNWFESHQKLQNSGEKMLTPLEFVEFLKYTKQNHKDIYNEITEVRAPWRAEWLDAYFKLKNNKLYINSNHTYQNGNLIPQTSEVLQVNTLMKDKIPGISLEDYLQNPTKQGFPTKKTKSGNLFCWAPMSDDNSVERFDAGIYRANLSCNTNPSGRYSVLGVRAAKQ